MRCVQLLSERISCGCLAEQVVAYKRLRGGVEILPQIPRSAAGKILRKQLKEIAKSPTTDTSTFSAMMME